MDCQMPVLDGFEATSAIRLGELPEQSRLPVIAMTANAMQGDRDRCLAVGMDDYLSKPIKPDELRAALEKWVGSPLLGETVNQDLSPTVEKPLVADVAHGSAMPAVACHENSAVIDFELLDDYFGEDPQVVSKLLSLFQSSTLTLLDKLDASVAQREMQVVYALAHELKGSCGNIGIERMAGISTDLETAASEHDWPLVQQILQVLHTAFADVLTAIAAHQPH